MLAFLAAEPPCFTFGLVEQGGRPCALIALRLDRAIQGRVLPEKFSFGHSMRTASDCDVVHFAFKFHEVATYNGLINPGNFVARAVLKTMVETGDFFFLALDSDGNTSAFRLEIGMGNIAGLRANMPRIQRSATSQAQYRQAVAQFLEHPEPPGTLLTWVCQDQAYALDLVRDRAILAAAQILT